MDLPLDKLQTFFSHHPDCAIGFSGGCDSTFLLECARRFASNTKAYCIHTPFQPAFELNDASEFCRNRGIEFQIIPLDILTNPCVASNPLDRCYHCKKAIFTAICAHATADGFDAVCDGTNASDDIADRPGWRALQELSVYSPLREAGLTKEQIRTLSAQFGLPSADKPAYACLATRIMTGYPITNTDLKRIETAENSLHDLGFRDFRIRLFHGAARLQFTPDDLNRSIELRIAIREKIGNLFDAILIDTQPRNEA